MKIPIALTSLCAVSALTFTACDTPEGLGAMSGAGAGALLGSRHGHHAVEGAALGAAAGAIIGHLIGHSDDRGYYRGRRYPLGRSVGGGYVESPYSPYNIINVRGIPHGAVVEDPSTGGLFVKP
jgi:predicted small secreted protein